VKTGLQSGVFLTRLDREKNVQRWYRVEVCATLFHPVAVVCSWGRLGTSYQRQQIIPVESWKQGETLVEKIWMKKLKRGYAQVTCSFRNDFTL
jgi:predicted DNA-binding WGR domain protein